MIDYAILRIIWWVLMGLLLALFAVMDGFDLGVAALLPIVARRDHERRIVINTVGPVWEGNQVWFILGGGVLFAAWPYLYAISFSGFYFAILLVLLTLILRPVAFKYRSKLKNPAWRTLWDWVLCLGGAIAALVFGVAVGNVMEGVPFHFDSALRPYYTGTFWQLFSPFAVLCGLLSVAMMVMQGAHYLIVKTEGILRRRAMVSAYVAAAVVILLFAVGGAYVAHDLNAYVLMGMASHVMPSNPVGEDIVHKVGAWINNYYSEPWLLVAPILGFLGAILAIALARLGRGKLAFLASSTSVFFIVVTVGVSMFPFIFPSSTELGSSLLVWNASASQLSLFIMFIVAMIFFPIIIAYTCWVYRVLRGQVTLKFFDENKNAY